jgi:hypothetical protein
MTGNKRMVKVIIWVIVATMTLTLVAALIAPST